MSRERALIKRATEALKYWMDATSHSVDWELLEDLESYLSTPEPTQDEEPVAWMLRIKDGKSYRLKSFTHIERRDVEIGLEKAKGFAEIETVPLYLHPAPRPEFVRLSEEEMDALLISDEWLFEDPHKVEDFAYWLMDTLQVINSSTIPSLNDTISANSRDLGHE